MPQPVGLKIKSSRILVHDLLLIFTVVSLLIDCKAWAPTGFWQTSRPQIEHRPFSKVILSKIKDDSVVDDVGGSLPSPDTIMENVLEGNLGERGEQYVIAQFSLLFFIAIGNVPFIGDSAIALIGPALIVGGLFIVYKSAADLKSNLSPWPVPTDPNSGRGSLVKNGIYSYIRHPMYTGVLLGMAGLSVITDSVVRILLTFALYYVLDIKSEFEEEKLHEIYGNDYVEYKEEVNEKFFPRSWKTMFDK